MPGMSFPLVLPSLKQPVLPRLLCRLPEAKTQVLFLFNALLEKGPKLSGPSLHAHLAALLQSDVKEERDLQEWLQARFTDSTVHFGKAFPAAQRQAGRWMEEGIWLASWAETFPPRDGPVACPSMLFGKGTLEVDQKWIAVFNSRKAKLVSPHAEWLQTLRTLLDFVASQGMGFASSLGTVSYDLVTVGAARIAARLLLLVPQALEAIGKAKDASPVGLASFPDVALSCLTGAADCPKAVRMVCRDRLLAFISDLHCILEVRVGGNLWEILERQEQGQPRPQLHCNLQASGEGKVKTRVLVPGFLQTPSRLPGGSPGRTEGEYGKSQTRRTPELLRADAIPWHDYLYHYTRSCPGPWPGQSYRRYLESLLDADPLAEHSALAALVRILTEERIRASCRIVRGNQGVVSWTSRPPQELDAIRRWNTALIRWTFEPYGLAVKRSVLRTLGARPAIYAASAVYGNLSERERFRFQLHDPPRCSWKNEREWRLPADLKLSDLVPDKAFLFMPALENAEDFVKSAAAVLPIVVLEGCFAPASNWDLTKQLPL